MTIYVQRQKLTVSRLYPVHNQPLDGYTASVNGVPVFGSTLDNLRYNAEMVMESEKFKVVEVGDEMENLNR